MKPKYIFSAVLAVSLFLALVLPGLGRHPLKTAAASSGQIPTAAQPVKLAASQKQPAVKVNPQPVEPSPAATPLAHLTGPTIQPALKTIPDGAVTSASQAAAPQPTLPPIDHAVVNNGIAAGSIPDTGLDAFAASFRQFPADQVAGAYVNGLFALPVVQQPESDPDFVSPEDQTLTQFSKPEPYGVIALLAHNYLSGKPFYQLKPNQEISIVYGGGRIVRFRVERFAHFQAIDPHNTSSDFVDLNNTQTPRLTHQEVFDQVYTTAGQLVLQTCIEENGDPSWGRLFIIATPE